MAKGGRGQCQKVGRTAGTGMLDGRVGRVAMSVAGGQCTVCRGGLGHRPVLSQSGCSAWTMARGAKQSGGSVGGGRLSKRVRMREGRVHAVQRGMSGDGPLCRRSNGDICGGGGCGRPGWRGQRWQETNYVAKLRRAYILNHSECEAEL